MKRASKSTASKTEKTTSKIFLLVVRGFDLKYDLPMITSLVLLCLFAWRSLAAWWTGPVLITGL